LASSEGNLLDSTLGGIIILTVASQSCAVLLPELRTLIFRNFLGLEAGANVLGSCSWSNSICNLGLKKRV
jgi:hypothetical protein